MTRSAPKWVTTLCFALPLTAAAGCSRTGLEAEEASDQVTCTADQDCAALGDGCQEFTCQNDVCEGRPLVDCDDHDACTVDTCIPATGRCSNEWMTPDLDHDGHREPLPGKAPTDPGACGDDCDDTNGAAFPGNPETCDGVDNDCDGIVDNGAAYGPIGASDVLVSQATSQADPGGLSWSGSSYLAAYTGQIDGTDNVHLLRLAASGNAIGEDQMLTHTGSPSYGGPLAFTGDRYGIAWSDARNGNYEVYFDTLSPEGSKLAPDQRITSAPGFSVNAALLWTGNEFVMAWQDERMGSSATADRIFAQRVGLDAQPQGANVNLSTGPAEAQFSPSLAAGPHGIGLAWATGTGNNHQVMFATYDQTFAPVGAAISISPAGTDAVSPEVVWNQTAYVIAWYDPTSPLRAVYGAARGEKGQEVVPATPITDSRQHSRFPSLLPLGDRLLLVWSDDKDGNDGYELYSKMLGADLRARGTEQRITSAVGDSTSPVAAFGPKGDVGILFRDNRNGSAQVYFTRLTCNPIGR